VSSLAARFDGVLGVMNERELKQALACVLLRFNELGLRVGTEVPAHRRELMRELFWAGELDDGDLRRLLWAVQREAREKGIKPEPVVKVRKRRKRVKAKKVKRVVWRAYEVEGLDGHGERGIARLRCQNVTFPTICRRQLVIVRGVIGAQRAYWLVRGSDTVTVELAFAGAVKAVGAAIVAGPFERADECVEAVIKTATYGEEDHERHTDGRDSPDRDEAG
jgi:hypothetical protein